MQTLPGMLFNPQEPVEYAYIVIKHRTLAPLISFNKCDVPACCQCEYNGRLYVVRPQEVGIAQQGSRQPKTAWAWRLLSV